MGSFSKGLYLGVWVLDSHGISFCSLNGMPFNFKAMRFIRAKGEGVAEIKVRGSSADIVGTTMRCAGVLFFVWNCILLIRIRKIRSWVLSLNLEIACRIGTSL